MELRLAPEWNAIAAAWEPCRVALTAAALDRDEAYQLAKVAQELLENAVKYGAFGVGDEIGVEVRVGPQEVTIEVRSRVDLDDPHLRRLERTIQWIRGYPDPFQAYVERLKLVAARPYAEGESGLGLTRIAYEGGCALGFHVHEGNVLSVRAVHRREREAA